MRLLPRTLLWRTFLLVALLMLLSVVAWFAIYVAVEREPRTKQTAQMVVSVVNITRTALVTAQPDMRRQLLQDLSDREGIRIYPAENDDKADPLPDRTTYRLIASDVRRQLGKDTRLSLDLNGMPGFWVSFHIADDDYWVVIPRDRLEQPAPAQWIGWAAASVVLSLAGAYLIVFGVTKPLKALAAGATAIGRGDLPPILSEAGATEIATVSHTFNQMSRDLQQLDADRALILAGVSHDLRTPLARLRLNVEMSGTDETTRQSMNEDIDDMDQVIGQFLDFARQRSDEPARRVDFGAIIGDLSESYRRRGLSVEVHLAPLPEMTVRPRAIRRLMANLLDNALHYAGKEKPIEIHGLQEGNTVVIEIQDRGPGIPADQIEHMKRPFTRMASARSDASGAGLGLAIVDRIARVHDGTFDLLPRAGGGLIARIVLPIAPGSTQPGASAA